MAAEKLKCKECGADYPLEALYVCERCFGPLEVSYTQPSGVDLAELRRRIQGGPQNIWRYADFLPALEGPPGPSNRRASRSGLPAGCTPLIRADRLAEELGLRGSGSRTTAANPTCSFKDRVVAVARRGPASSASRSLACASTGNLANAVAAARRPRRDEGVRLHPERPRAAKMVDTGVYGATLVAVKGTYDDVNRLCTEIAGEQPTGPSSTSTSGRTTPRAPRPSATRSPSSSAGGARAGRRARSPRARSRPRSTRLRRSGSSSASIDGELPKMYGAQATGCSPVANAFDAGHDSRPVKPDTIAKSLAIGNPADGPYALDLARRSGGAIDAVTDEEVREGIALLARTTGRVHRDGRRRHHRHARRSSPPAVTSIPTRRSWS